MIFFGLQVEVQGIHPGPVELMELLFIVHIPKQVELSPLPSTGEFQDPLGHLLKQLTP